MTEMGSTKGFDPMPPDQHRYFLGKKESPLQRLLALVRCTTIGQGRRSPYCVDEHGREMHQADLRRELGMDWGNFRRAFIEAVTRGLIREGDRHHRAHKHRIYLCGTVSESVGYKESTEGPTSLYRLVLLTPTQRKIYDGWTPEKQARFYADFEAAVNEKEKIENEALARAREITRPLIDQVLTAHELPVKRLKSVPTSSRESAQTQECESVPTGASLMSSDKTEREGSSSSVLISQPRDEGDEDDELTPQDVAEWMQEHALAGGKKWGVPDLSIVRRVVKALNGARGPDLQTLADKLCAQSLYPTQSYAWFVSVVEEAFHELQNHKQIQSRSRGASG